MISVTTLRNGTVSVDADDDIELGIIKSMGLRDYPFNSLEIPKSHVSGV